MSILDRIVADTRADLRDRKAAVTLSSLEDGAYFNREPIDLRAALRSNGISIISEVKKASPSRGVIREDFKPAEIARSYEKAGATAVSVLTEPRYFSGSLDDLQDVRRATSLPILRKDFIVDVFQLFEARACGADAVLLIAAVLDRIQLHDLVQASIELGLTPLVEVYEASELDRIDFDEVTVLGVNNRNLHTFEVDLTHSLRVFADAPQEVVRVSESGISTSAEVIFLAEHGIDAVLVGEALMRANDPGKALAQFWTEVEEAAAR